MDINKKNIKLDKVSFSIGFITMAIFIVYGLLNQEKFGKFLNMTLDKLCQHFGWLFLLVTLACMIAVFILAFTKYGDIIIGGKDAKPDYTLWQWFSMSLCGCIGTGILFWAMGEPMFHYTAPPVAAGVEPFTREAGIFAVSQTMWHWTIPQYAIYSLCGIAVALSSYNLKNSLSFGALYETVFPKNKKIVSIIHGICIFCLLGSTASSMGAGLLQIGSGLKSLVGLEPNKIVWFTTSALIIAVYTISSISGLKKGMAKLSSFCTIIFIAMLTFIFVTGPSQFILDMGTESLGAMLKDPIGKTLILPTMTNDPWSKNFIIQYMASFFVVGPILGMFLSRLGKGRTVRQFILVNIFAPTIFCVIWIAIFGGTAIYLEWSGVYPVWEMVSKSGLESTIYNILNNFPMSKLITATFVIAVFVSFTTMADPITSALATISVKGLDIEDEAPIKLKTIWGCFVGLVSFLLVASGGITSIKGMFTLVGLPIMFLVIIFAISAYKQVNQLYNNENVRKEN